jgi:hypothetical protein
VFAAQMSMNTAEPAESASGHADTLEVRQLDAPVIAYHYVFDMALPIYQDTNLPTRLVRKLGYLPGKLGGQNLVRRDPPRVEFLYAAQLIGLQTQCVS